MINEIKFLVQGSAPDPYNVVFKKIGNNLTASCTCPAGVVGQHCKHRIRIMLGDQTGIISKNLATVSVIQKWLCGTDVEKALHDLHDAEQHFEEAKNRISLCKKRLARSLRD
jgi:hypothetical protein